MVVIWVRISVTEHTPINRDIMVSLTNEDGSSIGKILLGDKKSSSSHMMLQFNIPVSGDKHENNNKRTLSELKLCSMLTC